MNNFYNTIVENLSGLTIEELNKIIEIAEEFGKNVATYLDTIKTYSDRIFFISTTIQ